MRIAIAKEGNAVSGHFGHCEGFEVFDVENEAVLSREYIVNPGHRPGFLPVYLSERRINVIIAGGMGETAQDLFKDNKIDVFVGVEGQIEAVIKQFMDGKLISSNSVCSEHAHEGHCNG